MEFNGMEISDEMLEQVSGGMFDLGNETITITVADFVKAYKQEGLTLDQAKARQMEMLNTLISMGVDYSPEQVANIMAQFDQLW